MDRRNGENGIMSQTTQQQPKSPPRPPDYDVVCARPIKRDGEDARLFTRIGSAWARDKGGGFSLHLNALPIGDRVFLFERREPETGDSGSKRQQRPA